MDKIHREYMKRCLELASKGKFFAAPNPMVGSVIVHEGKIISEGFHSKYGEPHAERNALDQIEQSQDLSTATLYVNLEPCSHFGKTPPCADYIIERGIKKVVIGTKDTSTKVNGKGIEKLKASGIEVTSGVLEKECRCLNRRFFTYHEKNRPYIILKWAETSDGFIADQNMNSKWISSEASRELVHQWRCEEQSIMVGTNTARFDNPTLTARPKTFTPDYACNPIRLVVDKDLSLPLSFNIFNDSAETIVINKIKNGKEKNLTYLKLDFQDLITELMPALIDLKIISILVEGGSGLINSFLKAGTYDEIRRFKAIKEFGSGIHAPKADFKPTSRQEIATDVLEIFDGYKA